MALRGNLKDFSLPDVFQLVQLSGKTGVLRIAGPDAEGSIWFRDGDVFFAQSNWRRDHLGERLVTAQRITPAALARALELREAEPPEGRRLGQILVDEGYITQQVLESFVQEQILDTIFDLMRWDEGDFDFEVLPDVVHEDIGLSVSVENIVMEGSRRLEEWNRIRKKVPSTDMVFKMATAPGEGTFEISLKPVEWNLLLLVDGTRSVAELAHETGRTDFEVARVIYGLFSAGLLEVPTDEEVERLRADRARREDKRAALDAARAAREEADKAEALGIEEQLAREAAERMGSAESAPATEEPAPAVAETAPHVPEAPHEEPAFLSSPGAAPSADDMAVFEEMMGAVLAPQAEPAAPVAPAPAVEHAEPAEAPFVVPEPPVAFSEEPQPVEAPAVIGPEPAVETPEVLPEPEAPPMPPVAEAGETLDVLSGIGALTEADLSEIPAPPVADAYQPPAGFVPTGDLEADLRSLGLGELPPELAAPEVPAEPAVAEAEAELGAVVSPELADFLAEEPPQVPREPMSIPAVAQEEADTGVAGDLDDLIRSLGAADEAGQPAGLISSGTDYGAEDSGSAGVISTDAFLADFDSDIGLSGGLGDELTALTGGGTARSRPAATVAKIPEPGEGVKLHRDQMVDRTLIEKIIQGIENL